MNPHALHRVQQANQGFGHGERRTIPLEQEVRKRISFKIVLHNQSKELETTPIGFNYTQVVNWVKKLNSIGFTKNHTHRWNPYKTLGWAPNSGYDAQCWLALKLSEGAHRRSTQGLNSPCPAIALTMIRMDPRVVDTVVLCERTNSNTLVFESYDLINP